jgi:hypothetical protein
MTANRMIRARDVCLELINVIKGDAQYGVVIALRRDEFKSAFRFQTDATGYKVLRDVLSAKFAGSSSDAPYRYFMIGGPGLTTMKFYVVQGVEGQEHSFELPKSLKENLNWLNQKCYTDHVLPYADAGVGALTDRPPLPPQLVIPSRNPQATDPALVGMIKARIDSDLNGNYSYINAHNVDVRRCLVEPYPVVYHHELDSKDPLVDLYVVLKEDPVGDSGYQIVYNPAYESFGLAASGCGGAPGIYMGSYGDFFNALKCM